MFDLDALSVKGLKDDVALNSKSLLTNMKEMGLLDKNYEFKEEYKEKIVLIPVEFCFETIYLYSNHLIDILANIEKYSNTQNNQVIRILKSYYDYSVLHPEYFNGAATIAENIHRDICKLKGDIVGAEWKAQQIHLAFSKNLLTTYFRENGYELKSDKICEKKETKLFQAMIDQSTDLNPIKIIQNFYDKADVNKLFARMLMCDSLDELNKICTEATLENALNIIETYNDIVKRPYKRKDTNDNTKEINKTQSRLSACKTNIDIMLGNGIKSIKTIRSNLKTMGFDDDIINEAIDSLSVM